jgi:hypothetical protein
MSLHNANNNASNINMNNPNINPINFGNILNTNNNLNINNESSVHNNYLSSLYSFINQNTR